MRTPQGHLLMVLTDEEVDVLVERDGDVVARPFLDQAGAEVRRHARMVAARSLGARGLIAPPGGAGPVASGEAGGTHPLLDQVLTPALQVRRAAPVVLVLHCLRADPGTVPLRYLFVLDDVVLVEDVTVEGVHTFVLGASQEVDAWLTDFLLPGDADGVAGHEVVLAEDTQAGALFARLGDPVVVAEVTVMHPWQPAPAPALLLLLGPGGCWWAHADDVPRGPFHPDTPQGVIGVLEALLATALAVVDEHLGAEPG